MTLYRILLAIFTIWCAGCSSISNTDVQGIVPTESLTPVVTLTESQGATTTASLTPMVTSTTVQSTATTVSLTPAVPTPTPTETKLPTPQIEGTVSVEQQIYVAEEFNFQFTLPDGYLLFEREHPDALLVVSLHEASVVADEGIHKLEIFITVHKNQENLSVQAWFEAHTADVVSEMYPTYVGPRNVHTKVVADRDALSFEDMTFSHAHVTLIEGEGYILAMGFVPFDYTGLAADYEHVLDSLAFNDLLTP